MQPEFESFSRQADFKSNFLRLDSKQALGYLNTKSPQKEEFGLFFS